jgi:hypothetical protein
MSICVYPSPAVVHYFDRKGQSSMGLALIREDIERKIRLLRDHHWQAQGPCINYRWQRGTNQTARTRGRWRIHGANLIPECVCADKPITMRLAAGLPFSPRRRKHMLFVRLCSTVPDAFRYRSSINHLKYSLFRCSTLIDELHQYVLHLNKEFHQHVLWQILITLYIISIIRFDWRKLLMMVISHQWSLYI